MLPQLSSKLIFRRLLNNVTKNTVFSFNGRLYRQTDGCGMGNPLSPVVANIFMSKLEADVVRPYNPTFYDRYVDDCFSKKRKDEPDKLLDRLNNYHPNINFTVEENPDHFLDTAFTYGNDGFDCKVYKKPGKLPTHWTSEVPIKWKRNCVSYFSSVDQQNFTCYSTKRDVVGSCCICLALQRQQKESIMKPSLVVSPSQPVK